MKVTVDATARDFVMARLAAARTHAQAAVEALDEALAHWTSPEEDDDGKERAECLEEALTALGCATRSAECAEESAKHADLNELEPWDEDDEDDDGAE